MLVPLLSIISILIGLLGLSYGFRWKRTIGVSGLLMKLSLIGLIFTICVGLFFLLSCTAKQQFFAKLFMVVGVVVFRLMIVLLIIAFELIRDARFLGIKIWFFSSIFVSSLVTYGTLNHVFVREGAFWERVYIIGTFKYVDLVLASILGLYAIYSAFMASISLRKKFRGTNRQIDIRFVDYWLALELISMIFVFIIYAVDTLMLVTPMMLSIMISGGIITIWSFRKGIPLLSIGSIRAKGVCIYKLTGEPILCKGSINKDRELKQFVSIFMAKEGKQVFPSLIVLSNNYGIFKVLGNCAVLVLFDGFSAILREVVARLAGTLENVLERSFDEANKILSEFLRRYG